MDANRIIVSSANEELLPTHITDKQYKSRDIVKALKVLEIPVLKSSTTINKITIKYLWISIVNEIAIQEAIGTIKEPLDINSSLLQGEVIALLLDRHRDPRGVLRKYSYNSGKPQIQKVKSLLANYNIDYKIASNKAILLPYDKEKTYPHLFTRSRFRGLYRVSIDRENGYIVINDTDGEEATDGE